MNFKDRCEFVKSLPDSCCVGAEIGVETGLFSEMILQNNPQMTLYSIDMWDEKCDMWAKPRPQVEHTAYQRRAERRLKKFDERSHIMKMTSEEAVSHFEDNFFDFIYIDANHRYDQVKLDLQMWWSKLKINGIFAGHDFDHRNHMGVVQAVMELSLANHLPIHVIPVGFYCHDHDLGLDDSNPSWAIIKRIS